jgi:hypothetical protein
MIAEWGNRSVVGLTRGKNKQSIKGIRIVVKRARAEEKLRYSSFSLWLGLILSTIILILILLTNIEDARISSTVRANTSIVFFVLIIVFTGCGAWFTYRGKEILVEYEKTLQSLKGLEELHIDPLDERSFGPTTRIVTINRDDKEINTNPQINPLSPSASLRERRPNTISDTEEAERAPPAVTPGEI